MDGSDVSGTVDGLYYGFVVSLVFFGITISQAWIYLHNNSDKWPLRLHVLFLLILDVAETSCVLVTLHRYLIANFGNLDTLSRPARTLDIAVLISGFTFFFAHVFFATRLYFLSKTWWIPGLIVCLSLTMLVVNTHVIAVPSKYTQLSDFNSKVLKIEISIIHVLEVVTDVIVTLALLWYLSRMKTETQFTATRKVIYKLFIYCITRGLVITAVEVAHQVMYFTHAGDVLYWISLHLVLSKLYIVTMFVMLNSRPRLRKDITGHATAHSVNFVCTEANAPTHVHIDSYESPPATDDDRSEVAR